MLVPHLHLYPNLVPLWINLYFWKKRHFCCFWLYLSLGSWPACTATLVWSFNSFPVNLGKDILGITVLAMCLLGFESIFLINSTASYSFLWLSMKMSLLHSWQNIVQVSVFTNIQCSSDLVNQNSNINRD